MRAKGILLMLLLVAGLLGCGRQPEPRHIVILPDVSGSIERESLNQAFKAIDGLVGKLHRGDRIAIIPILGDAQAEASGRIIRFEVPMNRQAYDSDLKAFRQKLKTSLATMEAEAIAHPGAKTDILGSVELAAQEFAAMPGKSVRQLLVLSDFIQEDQELNFKIDSRLGHTKISKEFATKLLKAHPLDFQGTRIYLGLLRSSEYETMTKARRDALEAFWLKYLSSCNSLPRFMNDGPGLIENAM